MVLVSEQESDCKFQEIFGRNPMDKEFYLRFLLPHREDNIPIGAYVSEYKFKKSKQFVLLLIGSCSHVMVS